MTISIKNQAGKKLRTVDADNLHEADLHEADLREANLCGANLSKANLYGADLRRADLSESDLRRADLREADLHEADLYGADLYGANLYGANLCGANLHEADLCGADLRGARGIVSFGPIGNDNRIAFAYVNNGIQTRIGCFSGDHNAAIDAIQSRYGQHSTYELLLRAAVWSLAEANPA